MQGIDEAARGLSPRLVERFLYFHFLQKKIAHDSSKALIFKPEIIDLPMISRIGRIVLLFDQVLTQINRGNKLPPAMKRHHADAKRLASVLLRFSISHHVVRKTKHCGYFLRIVSLHLALL
jgi:hypothetical protein